MASKQRLTITVDPELAEAGQRAVDAGEADSISAWVNAAIAEKVRREDKLRYLALAVADYEAEFGEITEEEMAAQVRADRASATVVRGGKAKSA